MGTTSSYTNSGGTKADDELLGVRAGATVNLWPLAADPAAATDSGTDAYTVNLGRDWAADTLAVIDFGSANTTTTPTLENTGGAPVGAVTIKARDGSALWAGALNGVHTLQYDGTDFLVVDPAQIGRQPVDPEDATDGGTDAYASETTTAAPGAGKTFLRDFQSANTTASPTLDTVSLVDVAGNAWAGMIEARVHRLLDDGTNYVVLDPGAYTIRPVVDTDSITQHGGDNQSIAANSYQTIFDVASPTELLGGNIFGHLPSFRLTIDGTVLIDRGASAGSWVRGQDMSGNEFEAIPIPQVKARTSMKLEAANASSVSRIYGWLVYTR